MKNYRANIYYICQFLTQFAVTQIRRVIIHIIMKYLVSKCIDCVYLESGEKLFPNVKYILDDTILRLVYRDNLHIIDRENSNLVNKIVCGDDEYYFLNIRSSHFFTTNFSYLNKIMTISIHEELVISYDGEIVFRDKVDQLEYSHIEKMGEMCMIYFVGERNYIVAFKKEELLFASYFDEYNEENNEKYFMCKLYDVMNHGRVYHISKNFEKYLVYLDDEDMEMREEFVGTVFLDCIMAENYKYANQLLSRDITQEDPKVLKDFFPEFDDYYRLDEEKYLLMKKNTLSGIYKFELIDKSISNIIELS